MASYTVSAGHRALGPWNLTASQVDTVTFTDNVGTIQVINDFANTADVWVTADATDPVVPGPHVSTNALRCPPGGTLDIDLDRWRALNRAGGTDEVRLVSSGTPSVSVQLD